MVLTQAVLVLFLLFALSRVVLRFRGGNVTLYGLVFWGLLFSSAVMFVLFPSVTTDIARSLGIGRGVDAVVYPSIVILFYLVFRLYVNVQNMKHEITKLVEKLALKEYEEKHGKKSS